MHENILPGLALDESESFCCVKPLYCSLFLHFGVSLFLMDVASDVCHREMGWARIPLKQKKPQGNSCS